MIAVCRNYLGDTIFIQNIANSLYSVIVKLHRCNTTWVRLNINLNINYSYESVTRSAAANDIIPFLSFFRDHLNTSSVGSSTKYTYTVTIATGY